MSSTGYLVIRLHPDSAVDPITFSSYLYDLQITINDAATGKLLGQTPVNTAPVIFWSFPQLDGSTNYWAAFVQYASKNVASGSTLPLNDTAAIPIGAYVISLNTIVATSSNSTSSNAFSAGTQVTAVSKTDVTLSNSVSTPPGVTAQQGIYFAYQYSGVTITTSGDIPSFSFNQTLKTKASKGATVLELNGTGGIAYGMSVSGSGIASNVTVVAADGGTVTLSKPTTAVIQAGNAITFSEALSDGIVQHSEYWDLGGGFSVQIPASVATAVVTLTFPTSTPPGYLNISPVVTRSSTKVNETIPVDSVYYNVIYQTTDPGPLFNYPTIPIQDTGFYITLPAPPKKSAIDLTIPSDGSAPAFLQLYAAMQQAQTHDPYFANKDLSSLLADDCARMAYDVVWSQQNQLPLPPDPLEFLYTDPPNTSGNGGDSSSSAGSSTENGDEQDRQKFEGTLNSFYSTRNATAERLAKFVAAASCALNCEKQSVAATQALLVFPVDPDEFSAPSPVVSEVLLTGVGGTGVNFGVPAAFFYALGANQDKSASATARYTQACGDSIQRLLQEFGEAIESQAIAGTASSEPIGFTIATTLPPINSAQAALRLSALGVTPTSTSPPFPLDARLTALVTAWLAQPATTTAPPTYQSYQPGYGKPPSNGLVSSNDSTIWTAVEKAQPNAFLHLVTGAMTQGATVSPNALLANNIESATSLLPANATVKDLKAVTASAWTNFFKANPAWIPSFVQPGNTGPSSTSQTGIPAGSTSGYTATCIKNFVRAVQRFFTVSSAVEQGVLPNPGTPPTFGTLPFDAIAMAVSNLPAGFVFGKAALSAAEVTAAVQNVFTPGTNAAAQAWLEQALCAINDLYLIAAGVPEVTPNEKPPASLRFSVMEALYARGFSSAQDIVRLSPSDFQQALTGGVAYSYATQLYNAAKGLAQPTTPAAPPSCGFKPINANGMLTDCVPPPCISPLGPVAYLQELLRLRQDASCEPHPPNQSPDQSPTLISAITVRRGPLDTLLASGANVSTKLPLIDIVNECLENVAATAPKTVVGAVYNTTSTTLAGYKLCANGDSRTGEAGCHSAEALLDAIPEWSSPAVPVQQPQAYLNLAGDFSSPRLPYSQPLDISRSYQRLLCACRADTMRCFRKEITEFVLAPDAPPSGFQNYLWRYPLPLEIAVEYLGLTPQEFATLFAGNGTLPASLPSWQLYGFSAAGGGDGGEQSWLSVIAEVEQFLERTGLTYCEFLELQQSGFIAFRNSDRTAKDGKFPDCEPCCLDNLVIDFAADNPTNNLIQLAIFIRLWRALQHSCCGGGLSFAQLADICAVLGPLSGGPLTAEFIRQLAALQMLRDHFGLPLLELGQKPTGTGADRTQLLALWIGKSASQWDWAIGQLLERVGQFAHDRHKASRRSPEFVKILLDNFDPLSRLAGFNPEIATDTWHARPTCTLRFAEILGKVYASDFSVGDLLFLFTAAHHLDGDDVYPLQNTNDALDSPLGLPEHEQQFSLQVLRHKLLRVEVADEDCQSWTWGRIVACLTQEFGYAPNPSTTNPDPLLTLAKHFFPGVLEASGISVSAKDRRFYYANPVATPPLMWNVPADGPFQCDTGSDPAQVLMWTQVPLRDEAVIAKLNHVRNLGAGEQTAIKICIFSRV